MAFRSCTSDGDLFDSYLASPPKNEVLRELNRLIDWEELGRLVGLIYSRDPRGRKGFAPSMMLKIILLQRLYGLSDPLMEHEIADRLSFREFLGLRAGDAVPDETTIVVFRRRLRERKLTQLVQREIDAQLREQGIYVREGSIKIVDASLIQAATNPPSRKKEADESAQPNKDREADFTVRNGRTHFGYKLHIAQDRRTGLITSHRVTRASVHDSRVFEELLDGREAEVLADKAYDKKERRERLSRNGTKASILRKAARGKPISWWWRAHNRTLSKTRNFIEGAFATLKRRQDCGQARYLGLERVSEQLSWSILAFNLRRAVALARE